MHQGGGQGQPREANQRPKRPLNDQAATKEGQGESRGVQGTPRVGRPTHWRLEFAMDKQENEEGETPLELVFEHVTEIALQIRFIPQTVIALWGSHVFLT